MGNSESDLRRSNRKANEAFREFGGGIKHAARCLLWLPEAQELKKMKKNSYLRYFTLPGNWAYDVFFFEEEGILRRAERGFPDVRFCDNSARAYTTAKKLLGNTIGKRGTFERLVLDNSGVFWDGFPYDLYNLDFCGTCFPDEQPPFSDTFQAIKKIVEEHRQKRSFPFTIFLTMKALSEETNAAAVRELGDNIEHNRGIRELTALINAAIPNTDALICGNYVDFILISIPKVIYSIAQGQCAVSIKGRAKYSRRSKEVGRYFIVKLVLRFEALGVRRSLVVQNEYLDGVRRCLDLSSVVDITNADVDNRVKASLKLVEQKISRANGIRS